MNFNDIFAANPQETWADLVEHLHSLDLAYLHVALFGAGLDQASAEAARSSPTRTCLNASVAAQLSTSRTRTPPAPPASKATSIIRPAMEHYRLEGAAASALTQHDGRRRQR